MNGTFWELWCEIWPILAATAVMAALLLLLREIAFAGPTKSPLIELILLSLTGVATYLGALFVVGRTVINEGAEVDRLDFSSSLNRLRCVERCDRGRTGY